ncbi:MAG: hypothetical protein KDD73_02235 [Anaerolineales bacterium]|nr:hypothetical protein [Anaerolineales bacterium]MCB9127269.1 HIT family protein [Ardenticatenales bacterium]
MRNCYTCQLVARRDAGEAPLWDAIVRTAHWDLAHAYDSSLLGWLVLVSRQHRGAVHELTAAEATELGPLLHRASQALQAATGCVKTYVMQFAEAADHPHVHFHIVPRLADLPDDRRGPHIFGYLGAPESERVSDGQMNEIARRIRLFLQ